MIFDCTNDNKESLKKYSDAGIGIKNKTKKIDVGECDYGKNFMKIKFNSDDDLPLNKPLKFHMMTIIIRSVFEEDGQLYPQFFLDFFVWSIKMLEYDRIDISEGIDVNKTSASKEWDICHYWYFKDIGFSMNHFFAIVVMLTEFIFWYMSKDDAVRKMNNSSLAEKMGLL